MDLLENKHQIIFDHFVKWFQDSIKDDFDQFIIRDLAEPGKWSVTITWDHVQGRPGLDFIDIEAAEIRIKEYRRKYLNLDLD